MDMHPSIVSNITDDKIQEDKHQTEEEMEGEINHLDANNSTSNDVPDVGNDHEQKTDVNDDHQQDDIYQSKTNSFFVGAVVVAMLSIIIYMMWPTPTQRQKPIVPIDNYECPDKYVYIPASRGAHVIDAFSKDPDMKSSEVICRWSYDKVNKPNGLWVGGKTLNECELKLRNIDSETAGIFDIKLTVKAKNSDGEMERTTCNLKVNIHVVPYFGIDLGTTYSAISYLSEQTDERNKRKMKIVVAGDNTYSIPTAVFIPPNDKKPLQFGHDALKMRLEFPQNVVYDIKRIIGRMSNDPSIQSFNESHSFMLDTDETGNIMVKIPKNIYNERNEEVGTKYDYYHPEQSLAPILAHLVHIASKEFHVPYITDIVISVPAYFDNNQRRATKNACKLAGLNPLKLIVEPTAAAISHAYYSQIPKDNFELFMVFDYGGGTLDVSILQCYGIGNCEVFVVGGNSTLGGIDYDRVIVDIMREKLQKQYSWKAKDFTEKMNTQLLVEAERVKMQLTKNPKSHPLWIKGNKITITRSEFVDREQTQLLLDEAVKVAKNTIDSDPDHVESNLKMILLVGGTSQIPAVKTRMEKQFSSTDIQGDAQGELAVVKGTAVFGSTISYKGGVRVFNDGRKIDVTPFPMGFEVCRGEYGDPKSTCGIMDTVVKENERYPFETSKIYTPFNPQGMNMHLALYEGHHSKVIDNVFLADVNIYGFTSEIRECDVVFVIDTNGILEINATVAGETTTMNPMEVLSDKRGLTDDDIVSLRRTMATTNWFPSPIHSFLSK